MIDLAFVFMMSLVGIGMLKLQKKLMPRTYFYYAHLIDGIDEDISWLGAFIRTLIPMVLGVITGVLAIKLGMPHEPMPYGLTVGLFTMFLLIWPDLLNPELISPPYYHMKGKLYTLYFIVLITFGSLGAIGGRIADSIYLYDHEIYSWIDARGIVTNLISGLIWAGLASLFVRYQVRKLRSSPQISDQSGTANRDADAGC